MIIEPFWVRIARLACCRVDLDTIGDHPGFVDVPCLEEVTTWRQPVVRTGAAANLGRKADTTRRSVGLTPEVGGCASLDHGLTTVVTNCSLRNEIGNSDPRRSDGNPNFATGHGETPVNHSGISMITPPTRRKGVPIGAALSIDTDIHISANGALQYPRRAPSSIRGGLISGA